MRSRSILLASALLGGCAANGPITPPQPPGPLLSLLSADDYPASALRAEEQGTVFFTLEVGPDGRVARCTVTSSSGSAALDSATCRMMTARARFRPALDRRNRPVAGTFRSRITWRITG